VQQGETKVIEIILTTFFTAKAAAKLELLYFKQAFEASLLNI
jgi:hypothetical protein